MTWHPHNEWLTPAPPIVGLRPNWDKIDTVVIHYTAADDLIDGDPGESADQLDDYLRAIQRSYTTSRGYSIGYNAAVDWLGGQWELRGFDVKCAANKDHNDHTFAILMLVDGVDRCTDLASAAVRDLVARAEDRAGRTLAICGHDELRNPHHPTGCPGDGLLAQIHEGAFAPHPNPSNPVEDDVMPKLIRPADDDAAVLLVDGLVVTWVRDQDAQAALVEAELCSAGEPRVVRRAALRALELHGPAPDYTGVGMPGRTVPSDFARWVP